MNNLLKNLIISLTLILSKINKMFKFIKKLKVRLWIEIEKLGSNPKLKNKYRIHLKDDIFSFCTRSNNFNSRQAYFIAIYIF